MISNNVLHNSTIKLFKAVISKLFRIIIFCGSNKRFKQNLNEILYLQKIWFDYTSHLEDL